MPLSAKFRVTSLIESAPVESTRASYWHMREQSPAFGDSAIAMALQAPRSTMYVVKNTADGGIGVGIGGSLNHDEAPASGAWPLLGVLPPIYPEWLGDRSFNEVHSTRFPYVAGAMANGIASTRMVIALAHSGCLAFFGAAGLSLKRVEAAIDELQAALDASHLPWGVNLIHSPAEPENEAAMADLLLRKGVRCVEASAYLALTPAVVRYACSGLTRAANGVIARRSLGTRGLNFR